MGFSGIPSAMASFGSAGYADYMVDAMANSWTRNLGIDGYCDDVNANYGCMLQTRGQGSMPAWRQIVARVRALQPQVVMSGEGYGSWDDLVHSDADLGGQGFGSYHHAMKQAVSSGNASNLEHVVRTSGADGATLVCYLHPAYDGKQQGGCPTLYFRDVRPAFQLGPRLPTWAQPSNSGPTFQLWTHLPFHIGHALLACSKMVPNAREVPA